MPTDKRGTSVRLSEECRSIMERLAKVLGVTQTDVIEMGVRLLDRQQQFVPRGRPKKGGGQ